MKVFNTFLELLKESLWTKSSSRIVSFISFLATIASITGLSIQSMFSWEWIKNINNTWWWIIIVFSILLITGRIVWIAAKRVEESNLSAKGIYTPSKLVKKISEIQRSINTFFAGKKDVGDVMDDICDRLREIFDKTTNSNCCVSIKIIEGGENGDFTVTLTELVNKKVRNIAHDSHNKSRRETSEYNHTEHFIRDNTAYVSIVSRLNKTGKKFYLNNDVDIANGYMSSSPYYDENGNITNPPYKSELVLPILELETQKTDFSFIGFLCIDSVEKGTFNKDDIGFELASMYANCLYGILPSYKIS